MRKHLRQFMVAAGLGAVATAQAETPPEAQLLASSGMMKHLEPIKTTLLKLSGKNTLVVSRSDLMTPEQLARQRIMERAGKNSSEAQIHPDIRSKMSLALSHFQTMLPERFLNPEHMTDIFTKNHFLYNWDKGYAGARPYAADPDKKTPATCVIVAPDFDLTVQQRILQTSGLPASMSASLRLVSDSRAFYEGTILHEAAHCGQDLHTSGEPLTQAFFALGYEIDADRKALNAYAQNYAGNPQKAIDLQKDWHAARAIGTVRNSRNFSDQTPSQYHTHSTNLALSEEGASLDPAAIILAASSFKEASNLMIGYMYGTQSLDIRDPHPVREAGTRIAQDNPYIQYAVARSMRDAMDIIHIQNKEAALNPRFALIERTTREYVDAFERLVSDAKTNPAVIDHEKFAVLLMKPQNVAEQLLSKDTGMTTEKAFSSEDTCSQITPRDQLAESILRAQEHMRFCRLKPPIFKGLGP